MRKTRKALLGILTMTSVSGALPAVPAAATERYIPGVYKAVPERLFSYPYGGDYLRRTKRVFSLPYYGSYYASQYYYDYWNYHSPYYW